MTVEVMETLGRHSKAAAAGAQSRTEGGSRSAQMHLPSSPVEWRPTRR